MVYLVSSVCFAGEREDFLSACDSWVKAHDEIVTDDQGVYRLKPGKDARDWMRSLISFPVPPKTLRPELNPGLDAKATDGEILKKAINAPSCKSLRAYESAKGLIESAKIPAKMKKDFLKKHLERVSGAVGGVETFIEVSLELDLLALVVEKGVLPLGDSAYYELGEIRDLQASLRSRLPNLYEGEVAQCLERGGVKCEPADAKAALSALRTESAMAGRLGNRLSWWLKRQKI